MSQLAHDLPRQLQAAHEAAAQIADSLAEPPPPEPRNDHSPSSPRWRGQSLSKGAAGIAVLHGVRAHAGLSDWDRAHSWLGCAAREDLSAGEGAGLWYGAPAVAFAMSCAASPRQYPHAIEVLDTAVTNLVRSRLESASARMAAAVRPSLAEFDLVRGLTGLGAYLLRHDPDGNLVRQVLTYLVQLTEPISAHDQAGPDAPGWWTNDAPSGQPPDAFRGGHADLGMAHGISGPLAFLALAKRRGVTVEGHDVAIDRICQWLDAHRLDGPAGPRWPQRVSLIDQRAKQPAQPRPGRPSWCYGTPGVARAQQLAGQATGDHARQLLAEHALASCLSDRAQIARITDTSLCHGWAGLVATAWQAAADAPDVAAHLPGLLNTLLDQANRDGPSRQPTGLIEGSAGIAVTLHSIASGTREGWETCLLIN